MDKSNLYDVRYSQGIDRYHMVRYQERIKAKDKENAKNIIKEKRGKERSEEKMTNIRVKEAQDYICWTYKSHKNDGKIYFVKKYYCGFTDLKIFGIAKIYCEELEQAKRFETEKDLKDELKFLNEKITNYKIEKVEAVNYG